MVFQNNRFMYTEIKLYRIFLDAGSQKNRSLLLSIYTTQPMRLLAYYNSLMKDPKSLIRWISIPSISNIPFQNFHML